MAGFIQWHIMMMSAITSTIEGSEVCEVCVVDSPAVNVLMLTIEKSYVSVGGSASSFAAHVIMGKAFAASQPAHDSMS